jgi:hypothetical protein
MSSTCASTAQDRQKQAEGEKAGEKCKKLKNILRTNTNIRKNENFTIYSQRKQIFANKFASQ